MLEVGDVGDIVRVAQRIGAELELRVLRQRRRAVLRLPIPIRRRLGDVQQREGLLELLLFLLPTRGGELGDGGDNFVGRAVVLYQVLLLAEELDVRGGDALAAGGKRRGVVGGAARSIVVAGGGERGAGGRAARDGRRDGGGGVEGGRGVAAAGGVDGGGGGDDGGGVALGPSGGVRRSDRGRGARNRRNVDSVQSRAVAVGVVGSPSLRLRGKAVIVCGFAKVEAAELVGRELLAAVGKFVAVHGCPRRFCAVLLFYYFV